ncbi:uncharacterized protein FOMMEDRAFT_164822 [Fomitiporia mediterranea MF3/22]|uniref:uncharacterized protein n=1 Tax=Fomitiporia mediterranea (strain MF3/22) TaxID=694068 RepID=UPI0004407B62|nr:uncharacterized protein FOMMEDRAFT_164822 [Fomitiporia mediterranea MF3/22]EJD08065.1 hypothetical protein FOMMEDRAFT_164822 [Fomitiporia mediterranea MF3/22]
MTSFRDYLRDNAKFYCPPVECHQTAFTAMTDVEVEQVLARWDSDHTVLEAHHDAQMVDALINVLNEELGESPTPGTVDGWFQQKYEQDIRSTRIIRVEPDAKQLFNLRHMYILKEIIFSLDSPVEEHCETAAPEVRSKVDFVLTTTGGKEGLVEIKAPVSSTRLQKNFLSRPMTKMTTKSASRYNWIWTIPRQE